MSWPEAKTALDRRPAAPRGHDEDGRAVRATASDPRANGVILKRHVHAAARPGTWLGGMLTRKLPMLVRVALANEMARPQPLS